jgi:pimeloyl-ACP methyl ester carboxylesterase
MTRLFSEPELSSLTDDLMSDVNQRLWILQRWGVQWELDATDQSGLAARSIIPQFFGGADQPDALVGIRNWTDGWLESLKQQDALVESGSLREFQTPVSVVFGENDPYLTPTLAAELASLFSGATIDIISGAGHYPQEDQPKAVADLLKRFI